MTSTATLYGYTIGLLFPVMLVEVLTPGRVILQTVERHADHQDGQGVQCNRPSAEGSNQAQESEV